MWVPLSNLISKGGETVEKDYLFQSPNPKVGGTLRACLVRERGGSGGAKSASPMGTAGCL
jgi:hypothetical protein